ncbi:MAG: hypothetical protein PWP24_365, partial [Clostridiales bacterium]|nr:hypothetical protein [Clostridiales bacterium]
RKKSHLSVAAYLVNSKGMEGLKEHKKSFYIGSILPDCIPSFITRRRCIEDTLPILRQEIDKITQDYDIDQGISMYYCRHLGVITHYIADYFTFLHNQIFPGNIKDHCIYEEELKHQMRQYVKSGEARKEREDCPLFRNTDEIIDFIKRMHSEYLKLMIEVKVDCEYIVELCHRVVDAILQLLELALLKEKQIQMA